MLQNQVDLEHFTLFVHFFDQLYMESGIINDLFKFRKYLLILDVYL